MQRLIRELKFVGALLVLGAIPLLAIAPWWISRWVGAGVDILFVLVGYRLGVFTAAHEERM